MNPHELQYHRSSYCSKDACIEVAVLPTEGVTSEFCADRECVVIEPISRGVIVRDSKLETIPGNVRSYLSFDWYAWQRYVAEIQAGKLDLERLPAIPALLPHGAHDVVVYRPAPDIVVWCCSGHPSYKLCFTDAEHVAFIQGVLDGEFNFDGSSDET